MRSENAKVACLGPGNAFSDLTRKELLQATEKAFRPNWKLSWFLRTYTARTLLGYYRTSVKRARKLAPRAKKAPKRIIFQRGVIPRREDLTIESTKEKEKVDGDVDVEWIQDPQALDTPHDQPAPRIILFLHGGGYYLYDSKCYRGITWRLAHFAQARVLSVDYRLAPESPFPCALQDALSAYSHLISPTDGKSPCYSPSQIVICGDSAGGGLAIGTMLYIRDHPDQFPLPAGLVGICPLLDLTSSMPSVQINRVWDYLTKNPIDPIWCHENRQHVYIPDNSYFKHPYVSPSFATEDVNRPICPTLIQIGEVELFRDESIYWVAETFKHSPISLEIYEDYVHDFHLVMQPANTLQAYQRIGTFVKDITSGKPFDVVGENRTVKVFYKDKSMKPVDGMKYIEDGWALLREYAAKNAAVADGQQSRVPIKAKTDAADETNTDAIQTADVSAQSLMKRLRKVFRY
ncbi:hypothetical protein SmJEL517_g02934 [Synchytrium microbalum]|uniref:Alpha/beta hydrolase fold-3 domain-containing protein n=1 Tax=Synchytrium microbalum TaxID=1806994 RepID=A0A507C491_9FUNG|nr:uncharacterized protein SmJEL517_g02934 [Synchytrium microbalum]TPX34291.1 hypothetical protein SmJEL517_g02934 [Synchytrium microbalum]